MSAELYEELEELYGTPQGKATMYYNLIVEELNKRGIIVEEDDERIAYAVTMLASERASIRIGKEIEFNNEYLLEENVSKIVSKVFQEYKNDVEYEDGIAVEEEKETIEEYRIQRF